MAADMRRIAIAAVDAAFDQVEASQKKKRRGRLLTPKRAVLGGAALVTAGRLAWSGRGQGLLHSLEDRLSGFEDDHEPSQVDDEGAEVEEEDEFDEPEAEEEPESDDERVEEPEDFEDDDFESEDQEDHADDEDEDVGEERATRRRPKAGARAKRRS